jgi:hypothetical protein
MYRADVAAQVRASPAAGVLCSALADVTAA